MGRSTSTGKLAALYLPVICQLGYNFRLAAAADVVVGGAEGWVDGPQYNPLQVQVGDVLVFNYRSGAHNVIQIPTLSCSAFSSSDAVTVAARQAPTPVRVPVNQPGVVNYACSVGDHCSAGQLIQVTASGGSIISSPTAPAPAPTAAAVEAAAPTPAAAASSGGGSTTPAAVAGAAGAAGSSSAVASAPPASTGAASGAGAEVASQQAYYRKYSYLKHIHAWLLGTAFIFVMPLAIVIARGYRSSGKVWFHLHWILQAIAAILVISGVVLGHYFAVVTDLQKAHRVIGIVAVSLLGVQVLVAAALRPQASKWIRKVWNVGHWNLGKVVLAMGIVNFFIGIHLYYDGELASTGTHIYIAAAVILGTFLLLAVLKDAYDHITKPQPSLANISSRDGVAYVRPNGMETGLTKSHADADLMTSQKGQTHVI